MTDIPRLTRFLASRDTSLDETFWNGFLAVLETRFGAIEQVTAGYIEAKDALVERGLTQVSVQLAAIVEELNTTVAVAQADLLNQVAAAQGEAQTLADTVAGMQSTIDAVAPALAALEGQIADILVENNLPGASVALTPIVGLTAEDAQAAFAELVADIADLAADVATAVSDASDAVDGLAAHAALNNPHGTSAADVGAVPTSRTISGAGLASGGGALSENRTITVAKSSQAAAEAGADDTTAMTPLQTKHAINALASEVATLKWLGASYTVSTGAPSGGVDGDFWFEREA